MLLFSRTLKISILILFIHRIALISSLLGAQNKNGEKNSPPRVIGTGLIRIQIAIRWIMISEKGGTTATRRQPTYTVPPRLVQKYFTENLLSLKRPVKFIAVKKETWGVISHSRLRHRETVFPLFNQFAPFAILRFQKLPNFM